MKKLLTILVIVVLVGSGMHITIYRHYCGGALADARISVSAKLASCGMTQTSSDNGKQQLLDQKCCEDQITSLKINSNFCPEYFKIKHPEPQRDIFLHFKENSNSLSFNSSSSDICVLPPGKDLKAGLSITEICVFRI